MGTQSDAEHPSPAWLMQAVLGNYAERPQDGFAGPRVWSYTDARYQPPPPYVPATEPYEPFALAAVELPEGLVVLGQVAQGYAVADLHVGAEVELVVETLYIDDEGERTTWRWKPVVELGEEADQ